MNRKAKWFLAFLIVPLALIALIIGMKSYGTSKPPQQAAPNFHPGLKCLDAEGVPVEIRQEASTDNHFKAPVPKGCGVLVALPDSWSDNWSEQQIGNDHNWQVYFKAPGQDWQGPYGWDSNGVRFHLPKTFLIQGTKDGEEILFSVDRKK